MAFILPVLLCLGLTLKLRTIVLAGFLPVPVLRAQPDSVVSMQTRVSFLCEGPRGVKNYSLYKKGSPEPWCTEIPPEPRNKAEFSIASVGQHHAGYYRCNYHSDDGVWSVYSDPLELVVTGIYSYTKPSLSALPSPVVTSGGYMTLQCVSQKRYDKFILTKEDQKFSSSVDAQYIPSSEEDQANISMEHVNLSHTGTFRCYGYYKDTPQLWSVPSEPLEIHITGLSNKPSLLTLQGHIQNPGMSLTLQCSFDVNYDRFALYKEEKPDFT